MDRSVPEILSWIVGAAGARLANSDELGSQVDSIRVSRPASLKGSGVSDLCFFFSREYEAEMPFANPGVLITAEPFLKPIQASGHPLWKKTAVISCADPYLAMALISEKFASRSTVTHLPGTRENSETQVHSTAIIHPSVQVGKGTQIGAHCVIDAEVSIGAGVVLYPGCYLGPGVQIGDESVLFAGVKVYEWARIGKRVRIHSGAVIGADGFGYAAKRDQGKVVGHQKIHHLGRVVIGDDVEIGANACVDRGTFADTRIENNVKLDNMVQIAHNVHLAEGVIVCGKTAFAGGSSAGAYAYIGGLTGVSNQVHIGAGAQVSALCLVSKDVPPGGNAVGNPQRGYQEHFRVHALLNRLTEERKKQRK